MYLLFYTYWLAMKHYLPFFNGKQGYVSVITEFELIGYPEITNKELKQIESFWEDCTVVEVNKDVKLKYVT